MGRDRERERRKARVRLTLSLCLVSSEMLPLGESIVGVGGVTVISGGNLVTMEGMKSFGILGGIRERTRLGSVCWGCSADTYTSSGVRERERERE